MSRAKIRSEMLCTILLSSTDRVVFWQKVNARPVVCMCRIRTAAHRHDAPANRNQELPRQSLQPRRQALSQVDRRWECSPFPGPDLMHQSLNPLPSFRPTFRRSESPKFAFKILRGERALRSAVQRRTGHCMTARCCLWCGPGEGRPV